MEKLPGKYVTWTGEVTYVSEGWMGGLSVGFRHKKDTLNYDVLVSFRPAYKEAFKQIQKGAYISYRGRLKSYTGAILPYSLDDGHGARDR